MWTVVATLMPAFVWSGYLFGYRAWLVTGVSVIFAVASEYVVQAYRRAPITVGDGSAVITGMLLAFVLPPNVPLWLPAVGAVIAVALVKQVFGGLGHNIWNPALLGRAALQLSFPDLINHAQWPILNPKTVGYGLGRFAGNILDAVPATVSERAADAATAASRLALPQTGDAVSMATPLTMLPQTGIHNYGYSPASFSMWMGLQPGSLGETSFILLALGCLVLVALRIVKWYVPVLYLGSLALMVTVLPYSKGEEPMRLVTQWGAWGNPLYHVMFGGAALGAFFMATDMVTTPLTWKGQVIFAVGCGMLTALIRLYGGYAEGVCYSILLMNTATPLIDRITQPRVYGTVWPGGRPTKGTSP